MGAMSATLLVILGIALLAVLAAIPYLRRAARAAGRQEGAVAEATARLVQGQLDEARTRMAEVEASLRLLQGRFDEERVRGAGAEASLAGSRAQCAELQQRLQAGALELERSVHGQGELATRCEKLQGELTTMRRVAEERAAAQEQAHAQMKSEFENLANRLFEDKGKAMLGEGRLQLDTVLAPLKEKLAEFQQKLLQVHETEVRERSGLKSELANLLKVQATLGEEAGRLSRALTSDRQAQGSWGELTLQRLLEASNLQRGIDYQLQVHARDDEGAAGRPDAVIWLPEGKALVVDAKVSLSAFVDATAASTPEERERRLAAHAMAVRTHMRSLSEQRYPELLGSRTLDLTILFLPSEPAFAAAMAQDPALWVDAFTAKVVLVSPTTLLATLRVVAQVWQLDRQNRNAAVVFAEATKLIDKFAAFVDDLDAVGRNLTAAQRSWDDARAKLSTGKGNLVARAAKLHKLGASNVKARTAGLLASQGEADDEEGDAEQPEKPAP
jgi:DNA recombination protein RmuC